MPNGPELSSPVVVGTRQTLSIWCTAVNTDSPGTVRGLHWRFPNNSRVPEVSSIKSRSEYDVDMIRYYENNMWIGILRMSRVQESLAGIYNCTANFSGMPKNRSMEIQVSGGCPLKKQHTSLLRICSEEKIPATTVSSNSRIPPDPKEVCRVTFTVVVSQICSSHRHTYPHHLWLIYTNYSSLLWYVAGHVHASKCSIPSKPLACSDSPHDTKHLSSIYSSRASSVS